MELLAAAIIMMRRRSTRLVAGQYVRTEAATLTLDVKWFAIGSSGATAGI
jgi:hypothetical protein